ncbi:Glycosyl transferase family 8 [Penicillium malachiteum]|uniref:Glycosyl transferase family 8 n=1 Tax=Penicillium malachiteum TaxID=1324776 RepID=A0AAD6HIZ3_9EURO|nr:Glycosyl transferase family 8 [Penicillium malachiteum]
MDYLPGLLTLHHSIYHPSPELDAIKSDNTATNGAVTLPSEPSRYPFVALYVSSFPEEGLDVLRKRGIATQLVPFVTPSSKREYTQDPRFADTWTKLVVFSLEEYERVVLLDADILVRRNMDELMEIELDSNDTLEAETAKRVFAATHACACNPMKKTHYPAHWTPENCAYTSQHDNPQAAQTTAPAPSSGVGSLNSGVLVITPSTRIYSEIQSALQDQGRIEKYSFPDQDLLADVFEGRWVAIPYVYNALKTLRWEGVHSDIWRDEEVKAVHYIFARKPWHEDVQLSDDLKELDVPGRWWWHANRTRKHLEIEKGLVDEF